MAVSPRSTKRRWIVPFVLIAVVATTKPAFAFQDFIYYCVFAGGGLPTRGFMSPEYLSGQNDANAPAASRSLGITWGLEFLWVIRQPEPSNHGILTGFSLTHHRLTGSGRTTDESWGTFYTIDAGYLRQLGKVDIQFTPGRNSVLTRIGVSLVGHAGDVYKQFNMRPSPALVLGVGYAIPRSPFSALVIDLRTYVYKVKFGESDYSDNSHVQVDFMLTLGSLMEPLD